jgi:heme-degrading monooxygenase HmoA
VQSVLFDVLPKPGHVEQYFSMAAHLKPIVEQNPGFISVERFENLQKPNWYLSFSCWKDEESLAQWRCQPDHNGAQVCGRNKVFDDYRLRVSAQGNDQEIARPTQRERILLLLGSFDEVQAVIGGFPHLCGSGKSYRGVLDPKRGLSIFEFDQNEEIPSQLLQPAPLNRVQSMWFGVVRDYGMFDRAEAPAQFA